MSTEHPFYMGNIDWGKSVKWIETDNPEFKYTYIDYSVYGWVSSLKVCELMAMLIDIEEGDNYFLREYNEEVLDQASAEILAQIQEGLTTGAIKATNYLPNQEYEDKLDIWEIELEVASAFQWIKDKKIIEKMEFSGIAIDLQFKQLLLLGADPETEAVLYESDKSLEGEDEPDHISEKNHRTLPAQLEKTGDFVFKKTPGDIWELAFDEESGLTKHRKGFLYIQEILRHPDKPISPESLQNIHSADPANELRTKSTPIEEFGPDFIFDGGGHDAILDGKTIKDCLSEIKEYQEEIGMLDENDPVRIRLENEMNKILKELDAATHKGKSKDFSSTGLKVYKAVSGTINNALEQIKAKHPNLHHHLSVNIKRKGQQFSYNPPPEGPPDWTLD